MAVTDLTTESGLITYRGSGLTTLDGYVLSTINRSDIMPDHKQYMATFGVVEDMLRNPSQTYSAESAPRAMEDILETGVAKSAEDVFTPKKGFDSKEISNKYALSKKFTEWARKAQNINGASGDMQSDLLKIDNFTRRLALSYDARIAEEIVKVFANGFSGGTLTPKGKNLFDTHTYGVTGSAFTGTFTNFTNGALTFTSSSADILAGTTRLQTLLGQMKQARDENGKYVRQPKAYTLIVSRLRSPFWKQVLNDGSNFSGQGSNANQLNQFNFKGNIVELVECDLLGQLDYQGNTIGTTDHIYVLAKEMLSVTQSLKLFRLYPLEIKTWVNEETDVLNIKGRGDIGVDHYGAELYIAGSTCA